jgi:hypothetical protein
MATATTTFGEFTLTASTPGNASAPITYTLTTPLAGGITFTQSALVSITATPDIGFGPGIQLSDGKAPINLPAGVDPATFIQQLKFAAISLDSDIKFLTTTVAEPVGSTPNDSNQPTISQPPTTTNPSNSLKFGDDIDDIYDPNLTAEQIASLDPRDQELRRLFFSDEDDDTPGVDSTDGEIIVLGNRDQESAFQSRQDWRVRLALSDDPSVNYLYKSNNPGILNPLNRTNGVLFPYTPIISVNYSANYNPTELVHNNYKVYQYSSSSIDTVTITCDFTAQDTYEANYLLAVIHFFRSATKMFYGQDENPRRGTPPPLCYIYGMGSYQFAGQPLAIQQFSYNLPNNVDYIKTSVGEGEIARASTGPRPLPDGVAKGGVASPPKFPPIAEPNTISWVPSKIQLTVTCVPMPSRNQVSNDFSFKEYATGALLNGVGTRRGAFW